MILYSGFHRSQQSRQGCKQQKGNTMKRFIRIPCLLVVTGLVAHLQVLNAQGADAVPPEVQKALELPKGDEKTKALLAAAGEWAKKDSTAALAWSQQLPRDIRRGRGRLRAGRWQGFRRLGGATFPAA